MKKLLVVFIVSVILSTAALADTFGSSGYLYGANIGSSYVPGELVITFNEGSVESTMISAITKNDAVLDHFSEVTGNRAVITVPPGEEDAYIASLKREPGVRFVEKNYILHAFFAPNDEYYNQQWHFNKPDFIRAEAGWDIERGESSVVIAVIDTGVAYETYAVPSGELSEVTGDRYVQAPDLAGTVFVPGYDFVHGDSHPNDQNGHGTHVAGTIAQTTNNVTGVAGLAHGCSIMPIQVLNNAGAGTMDDIADGIDFAVQNGAEVINMSLGGTEEMPTLETACNNAEAAGVVVIAASGNDGAGFVSYPAAYDSVVAVGSVDYNGDLAYYSNYGTGIEVMAPGGDTREGVDLNGDGKKDGVYQMTYLQMYTPGLLPGLETLADVTSFEYRYLQGTSMASPHVAALAALLISNGVTDPAKVRSLLSETATDLGASGYDTTYGYGLISCEHALKGETQQNNTDCGDCGDYALSQMGMFFGIFFIPYGAMLIRRKVKKWKGNNES